MPRPILRSYRLTEGGIDFTVVRKRVKNTTIRIKNGEVEKVLGKTVIFFAFLDETPCGFISLSEKDITCLDIESKHNITTLFVDKIARGQGLGETLIKTVIEYARQNQIDQIDAYTEFDGLYEKAGFIFLKEKVDSWNRPLRHYQIKL